METSSRRASGRGRRWASTSPASSGRPAVKPRKKDVGKRLVRAMARAGSKSDHGPRVAHEPPAARDRTSCHCGAVFVRKTWRRSARRLREAARRGPISGVCPACRQAAEGRAFGRVVLEGAFVAAHAGELTRRIRNVAARAMFTQPQRRLIGIVTRGSRMEVLTTSQKLAHRLAREIEKAFHGVVVYRWSDRDGGLLATWRRDQAG